VKKDDKIAFLAIPIVHALGILFIFFIGSDSWHHWKLGNALYPITLAFIIQWLAFIPAYSKRTEHSYDLVGGMTFIAVVSLSLYLSVQQTTRSYILYVMICIWAIRLSLFLFYRIKRSGRDSRFDKIKNSFPRFFFAWSTQALWISFTLAPTLAVILSEQAIGVDSYLIIGALIWIIGMTIEITADLQKLSFKSKKENQDKYIETGLWSISRHPNYFGEIFIWIGIAVIAFPVLSGWQYLTLTSPLLIYSLLRYISGVPLLEKYADNKWGHLDSYNKYKKQVPILFPKLPYR